jgi:hypothetical protein
MFGGKSVFAWSGFIAVSVGRLPHLEVRTLADDMVHLLSTYKVFNLLAVVGFLKVVDNDLVHLKHGVYDSF